MHWRSKYRTMSLFAPDKGAGGGAATAEDTGEEASPEGTGEETSEEEPDEPAPSDEPDEEPEEDPADPKRPAEPAKPEPKAELSDEDFEAEAARRGFKKEGAAAPGPKKDEPFTVRDYQQEAVDAIAARRPDLVEDDGFGGQQLTEAGQKMADNLALELAADAKQMEAEERQIASEFELGIPKLKEEIVEQSKRHGIAQDSAGRIADDYERIVRSYGRAAYLGDPKHVEMVHVMAAERAAGREWLRMQRESAGSGGDETRKEPVGAGAGGSRMRLSPEDKRFVERWSKERNGGKPPTEAQLKEMRRAGEID